MRYFTEGDTDQAYFSTRDRYHLSQMVNCQKQGGNARCMALFRLSVELSTSRSISATGVTYDLGTDVDAQSSSISIKAGHICKSECGSTSLGTAGKKAPIAAQCLSSLFSARDLPSATQAKNIAPFPRLHAAPHLIQT